VGIGTGACAAPLFAETPSEGIPMVRIELGQSPARMFRTAKVQVEGGGGGRRYGRTERDRSNYISVTKTTWWLWFLDQIPSVSSSLLSLRLDFGPHPSVEAENVFTIPTAEMTRQNIASDYIEWRSIQALGSTHENENETDMKDKELDNGR
jgi:hypothetical protein